MLARRWLHPWLLAPVVLAASTAAAAEARIADVRPVDDLPYVVVDVAYPRSWPEETSFTFEVDGKTAPSQPMGGGFDPDSNLATYLVFPGASMKRLVARWESPEGARTAARKIAWSAPALAVLLDRPGDRDAVLKPGPLDFQVFPPATARFFQDGVELPATAVKGRGPTSRFRG